MQQRVMRRVTHLPTPTNRRDAAAEVGAVDAAAAAVSADVAGAAARW
jgi:hypothetical protein